MNNLATDIPIAPGWHTSYAGLRHFCRRLVTNDEDADDLTQETLAVAAGRALPADPVHQRHTLALIARHRAIAMFRRRTGPGGRQLDPLSLDLPLPDDDETLSERLADPHPGTEERALCTVELAEVAAALRLLDPGEQQLLTRVRLRGVSQAAVAAELGVTRATINNRLARADDHLRAALAELQRGRRM
jgi:RNA polymerase sigma factor (sigma-70 family)